MAFAEPRLFPSIPGLRIEFIPQTRPNRQPWVLRVPGILKGLAALIENRSAVVSNYAREFAICAQTRIRARIFKVHSILLQTARLTTLRRCGDCSLSRSLLKKPLGTGEDRGGRLSHNTESRVCESSGTGVLACRLLFQQTPSTTVL